MEEIKLNLENLSKEERKQLMNLVEKANKPKVGRWKPKDGDRYWFFNAGNCLVEERVYRDRDPHNYYDVLIGNCSKNRDNLLVALEKRKVEVELQDIADELNDGWVPDWINAQQEKYFIYYDCQTKCFRFSENEIFKNPVVYFKNESIAKEAIKKIGEERLKKYYFEVE